MHDTKSSPRLGVPSAWRGTSPARRRLAQKPLPQSVDTPPRRRLRSFLKRAGEEIAEHPAETAALLAMVVAMSRLLRSRRRAQVPSGGDILRRRRAIIPISVMAALCILGLTSCTTGRNRTIAVAPDPNSYGREYAEDFTNAGRQIAEQSCASCHAIGDKTRSPHPDAPPMKTLLSRYDPDMLADDLIAGMRVGHDDMPRFDFNVIAADSLIAYLESISPKAGPR